MALVEHRAQLLQTEEVGPAIRLFRFEIPALESFDFLPGQWVSLTEDINGKKVTRAYSLASLPHKNQFEICLNRVENGLFTPFLFTLTPGDTIPLKGPVGTFTMRDKSREAILVATGTGVVPFRPMLQQALREASPPPLTLIFGARHQEGLMFHQEFLDLAAPRQNFNYIPTITRPTPSWTGLSTRVQPILWEQIGNRTDLDVYICGLKEMVDDVKEGLKTRGFDRKQIISEKFD